MQENKSDIACFRERQALEEKSARLALTGYAITARHDFIIARAQRGAERILRLIEEGKHEEAQVLMNTENWGVEEPVTPGQGPDRQQRKERKGKKRHA